ncbi:MAG TPA: serine/threonine-protein kinase [Polyangiaceae bacterium]|nr:serine/threonine-protein kinase [Polyangiaceae bacterium]
MSNASAGRGGPARTVTRASSPYEAGYIVAGRYALIRLVGEGGMGSVWVAWDRTLQVEVALKVVRGGAEAEKSGERLLREARATALLRHPAVVRVFDFGANEGRDPFIVMELLEGESMGERLLREGPFGAVRALRLLLPIIDGLDAAHAAGVVHRDLKPDNLFLARDERGRVRPKVVDFGIAKLSHAGGLTAKLTRGGSLLGTPEFMAPEQARGDEGADARTDVWALSVSLYELVSGRLPFTGANYNAVLRAILETEPTSLAGEFGVDEALWALLSRGLCKDAARRWPSMRPFGEALAGWLVGQGVSEDACGASLQAMWLAPRGRESSMPSVPRPSGGRAYPAEAETVGEPPEGHDAAAAAGGGAAAAPRTPTGDYTSLSVEGVGEAAGHRRRWRRRQVAFAAAFGAIVSVAGVLGLWGAGLGATGGPAAGTPETFEATLPAGAGPEGRAEGAAGAGPDAAAAGAASARPGKPPPPPAKPRQSSKGGKRRIWF